MSGTLWLSSLRYLLNRPWQMALSVLGITLGVAIVVAIDLGNQSAKQAFKLSSEAVTGKATHRIVGAAGGLPEHVYRTLRVNLGIQNSAPIVQSYAYLTDDSSSGRPLRLLGIDPFADAPFRPYTSGASQDRSANSPLQYTMSLLSEPNTALISFETANSLGLNAGDAINIRIANAEHNIQIAALITPQNSLSGETLKDLLITDISTAQELTGLEGRISYIDLIIPQDEQADTLLARISAALPPEATIVSSENRSNAIQELTSSFDDNLFVVSMLGLIVGAFLIYNAMAFSIVQRRPVIGALRALGVTRQQIFALAISEALAIGLISSVIGVLLGIIIGRGILNIITQTITDLFFVVSVQQLSIPAWSLIKGGMLGVFATLAAAFIPALEATSISARENLSRSHLESRFKGAVPLASAVGLALTAVGAALILLPTKSLILAFAGMGAVVLGYALLTPACVILFSKAFAPLLSKTLGAMGAMAARGIAASISRTAVAVAALAVAISLTISIDTMVQSFRSAVVQWLDNSLGSDIYLSPASFRSQGAEIGLPPHLLERIRAIESVQSVSAVRNARVNSPNGEVELLAIDTTFDNFVRYNSFKNGSPELIWDELQSGSAVAVSEPYAYHNNKRIGSTVRLLTSRGERDFHIAGIYYDYANSGKGKVMMSRSAYNLYWNDDRLTGIGVIAAPDGDLAHIKAAIRSAVQNSAEVEIRSNAELKAAALEVFERSFTITSVVHALSIAVAFLGVLSALMAMQMERSIEFGTLRALGMTPRQVWLLFTSQTALMGIIAGLLALPLGIIQSAVLIFVVNRRAFGWSMDMEIYPLILAQAVAIAAVAALLASIYPAIKMSRSSPAEALHAE